MKNTELQVIRRLFLILILSGSCWISIQSQSWTFSNMISAAGSFTEINSRLSIEGEILSYGYFNGTLMSADSILLLSSGGRDYYLIKFQPDGNVEWMKSFGSSVSDYTAGGIALDSSGNIYISGGFHQSIKFSDTDSIHSLGSYDMFLIKVAPTGETVWARNSGIGEKLQACTALEVDPSGDLILAGIFQDSIQIYVQLTLYSENSAPDYFFGKFESSGGDLIWMKQARSLNKLGGNIEHIHASSAMYLFTGNFYDSIGFESDTIVSYNDQADIQLIATDKDGNISWINRISGARGEYSKSVVSDVYANIYISGYFESDTIFFDTTDQDSIKAAGSNGFTDLFLAKYNPSGVLEWFKTAGGNGKEQIYDMKLVNDKLHLSGHFSDTLHWGRSQLVTNGSEDIDMFTGIVDRDGKFINARQYKGNGKSNDQSRGFHHSTDRSFTFMRTNSDTIINKSVMLPYKLLDK